jgi:aspartate aminotransferase
VSYAAQSQLIGRDPLFVPTAPGEGGVPDPDAMAAAVTRARAAGRTVNSVVVTLPDNPTGTLATPETVYRLTEVARALDLVIIADEIYRDLVYDDGATFASPAEYAPERTVVTTALSKSLALGGWRLGVARVPDGPLGADLRAKLLGIASEIWSCPSAPIQQVAAYAFGEPTELTCHVARSRRLHRIVAGAVADRFRAAKAALAPPQAAFYQYPDFETWRGSLALDHGVHTGADLAGLLMSRYGLGVLPASAFGEEPGALRLRVATGLLYGETPEQREAALAASEPLALPWIGATLTRVEEVLSDVTGG